MQPENNAFNREYHRDEFLAELTPHRSLGKTGFLLLMAFVSIICFISGMMFFIIGAWPVMIFLGLDVLIIWIAFKINYRSGRVKETVSVNSSEIRVCSIGSDGRIDEYIFNPLYTKFEVDRHDEIGIINMRLISREDDFSIGSFLNPDDRESFALAFGHAFDRVKRA